MNEWVNEFGIALALDGAGQWVSAVALSSEHWKDQPRVPAGSSDGGEWTYLQRKLGMVKEVDQAPPPGQPPRKPLSSDDTHKKLTAAMPELSDDQMEALDEYTSGAYVGINKSLRTGEKLKPGERGYRALSHIDAAIDAAPVLDDPVAIHRGIRFTSEQASEFLKRAKPGQEITDKAFVSGSIDQGVAHKWATGGQGAEAPVVMEINVKHGLYVGGSVGGTKEKEFILPRDARLKILEVVPGKGGGPTIVRAEQVLSGKAMSTDARGREHGDAGSGHGGQFVKGGGGSGGGPTKDSRTKKLVKAGKAAVAWAGKVEHAVTARAVKLFGKLPSPVRWPVAITLKASFASYIVLNKAARAVAREKGGEEHADRVAKLCVAVDLIGAKAGPMAAKGLLHVGAGLALATSFVPIGSSTYLAYSAVRNPLATLRAAQNVVAKVVGRGAGIAAALAVDDEQTEDIIKLLGLYKSIAENKGTGYPRAVGNAVDWFDALLHAALDETEDLGKAVEVATEAMSGDSAPMSVDAFLAHDIHNRKAQGILNRTLEAARGLSEAARADLAAALKKTTGAGEAILEFVNKYRTQLADLLTTTQLAALLEGAREVATKVPTLATFPGAVPPPPTLEPAEAVTLVERLGKLEGDDRARAIYDLPPEQQVYAHQALAAREASPTTPPPFTPPVPQSGAPDGIHLPTIEEAARSLAERNVLTRDRYDALDAAARAKAFTVANVAAEETLTKIRDSLAKNIKEDADHEAWWAEVLEDVGQGTFMSDAHAETVFRTNVQTAFSDGQASVLAHPLVRGGFPYSSYDAIHDDRVREDHLALETLGIGGTNIYRNDDPVFQVFRPPWDYNDRCGWTPITVRQAAERGIEEAKAWLATGVEPSKKAHVAMPPFQPPEGFRRAVASAPLSVQLSLQPTMSFAFDPSEERDDHGRWTKGVDLDELKADIEAELKKAGVRDAASVADSILNKHRQEPKPDKQSKTAPDVSGPLAKMQAIKDRADALGKDTPEDQIGQEVTAILDTLSKDEVIELANKFQPWKVKSRKDAVDKIVRKVTERKRAHDSIQFSLEAEILVALFGDDAIDAAFARGFYSGPTPPAKTGWVQIAPGPKGGKRWAKVGSPAATSPASGIGSPPSPTPAPPPPTPASAIPASASPAGAVHIAITVLKSGQNLSQADKLALAAHLPSVGRDQLKALHSALGAGGVYGTKAQIVAKVQAALTGGAPPVTPPPTVAPTNPVVALYNTGIPDFDDTINNVLAGNTVSVSQIDAAVLAANVSVPNHTIEQAIKALGGKATNPNSSFVLSVDLRAALHSANAQNKVTPPSPTTAPPPPVPPKSVLKRGRGVITGVAPTLGPPAVAKSKVEENWEVGKPKPGTLNGIDFAPAPPKFWEKVKDVDVGEPPPLKKIDRVSVLIQEPDGRVWIVQPTNEYGGRKYTMPGGGVEKGLTDQQNALKEVWEETGLQVEITGFAGDFEDSNNGNNGRLYIGRRVGGAPWDAKIESHIISSKTGKPAAESEVITLVPPERAAQLLHRTDDLAQIMVAHPPKVDTPTRGAGSNPIKKFLKAIEPKAKDYLKKNNDQGDGYLHAVQELRGFNAKPKVVDKKEMDKLVAGGGHIEMLRGVKPLQKWNSKTYNYDTTKSEELAEQFRSGDHFPGFGCFGNGTYADSNKGRGNKAYEYAGNYGTTKGDGTVIRMALPKTAKIIKQSELEKMVPRAPDGYNTNSSHGNDDQWLGVQAALAGYDAIEVDGKSSRHYSYGKGFYVILNRGALVVQQEDASTHVIR